MNRARGNGSQRARNKASSARITRLASAAALLALFSGFAMAAGGHHAVDDAAILGEGACEVKSWIARGSSATGYGLAAKWATELATGVNAGVRWSPGEDRGVDLSRAQRLSGPGASDWTLGATWEFPR